MADDEFSMLADNAGEVGLSWSGPPAAVRRSVGLDDGREVSAIVWGNGEPEIVLLHGGGQNAHTWDTVVLALGRSVVAVDLPGHGHSSWRDDGQYEPVGMALDVATAVETLAPRATMVVGMSLGGLTAIVLAARRTDLVGRLALVDVAPSIDRDAAAPIGAFIHGPESFATTDEIVGRAMAFNPTRSESSLRRGVVHNTRQRDDGRWMWRHHFGSGAGVGAGHFGELWDDLSAVQAPLLLVLGGDSRIVTPEGVDEVRKRQPRAAVVTIPGAGHSIQGDQPLELARVLEEFLNA